MRGSLLSVRADFVAIIASEGDNADISGEGRGLCPLRWGRHRVGSELVRFWRGEGRGARDRRGRRGDT